MILLILAMLAGCSTASNTADTEATTQPATQDATQEVTEPQTDPVADMLAQMPLEEKVGQLFMIHPESVGITSDPTQISGGLLAKYHVGGFVLAQSNLVDENQIIKFNAALTGISPITPLFSVDEEGGTVARFANHDGFNVVQHPSAAAISAGCDMILGPADFEEAYNAVLEAVQNGTLTEQRIDESVYRILSLKQAYGLL